MDSVVRIGAPLFSALSASAGTDPPDERKNLKREPIIKPNSMVPCQKPFNTQKIFGKKTCPTQNTGI